MKFRDRAHAANLLASKLKKYASQKPLVLGVPRGAVPMAKIIADALRAPLGIVLVRKIPHPASEELAIGCVGLDGQVQLLPDLDLSEIPSGYIERAVESQLMVLRERQRAYGSSHLNCKGRVVILVDDGIATGATTRCAIEYVRALDPKKLILAAAVIPKRKVAPVKKLVDELVVLYEAERFFGVGEFFEDFTQVPDDEVKAILSSCNRPRSRGAVTPL